MNDNKVPTPPFEAAFDADSMVLSFAPSPKAKHDIWLEEEGGGLVIGLIDNIQRKMSSDNDFHLAYQPHKMLYRAGNYALFLDIMENGKEPIRLKIPFALDKEQASNANYRIVSTGYRNMLDMVKNMAKKLGELVNLPAETESTLAQHKRSIAAYMKTLDELESGLAAQIATVKANNGKYDGILWSARKNLGQAVSDMIREFEGSRELADMQWGNFLLEKEQEFEALKVSLSEKPPVVPRQFTEAVEDMKKLRADLREYANDFDRRLGQKVEVGPFEAFKHDQGEENDKLAKRCAELEKQVTKLIGFIEALQKQAVRLAPTATATPSATPPPATTPAPVIPPATMGVPPLPSRLEIVGTKVRGLWAHADRRQVAATAMIIIAIGIMVWFGMARYANHHASQIDAKAVPKATAERIDLNWQSLATRKIEYIGSY